MDIAIVYHSTTGTTAKAAEAMGRTFREHGHQCRVESVLQADPVQGAQADLLCIGTWVRGFFVVKQHPTFETMYFIDQLESLKGKEVLLFCTYKLAIGPTLNQMAEVVKTKGAVVVGEYKFRGSNPSKAFLDFVASLV